MARIDDEGAGFRIQRRVGAGVFKNCRGARTMPTRQIAGARFKQLVKDLESRPPGKPGRTVEYRLVVMRPQEIDRYTVEGKFGS